MTGSLEKNLNIGRFQAKFTKGKVMSRRGISISCYSALTAKAIV